MRFTRGREALYHLPFERLYRSRLPRTKLLSPYPASHFDGEVVIGGDRVELAGWPGMVGHNWGAEHAERWIWLQGSDLGGRTGDYIDVALGRVKVGRWTTPWVANGQIVLDGEPLRIGGSDQRLRNRCQGDAVVVRVRPARTQGARSRQGRRRPEGHRRLGLRGPKGPRAPRAQLLDREPPARGRAARAQDGRRRGSRRRRRTSSARGTPTTASRSSPTQTADLRLGMSPGAAGRSGRTATRSLVLPPGRDATAGWRAAAVTISAAAVTAAAVVTATAACTAAAVAAPVGRWPARRFRACRS